MRTLRMRRWPSPVSSYSSTDEHRQMSSAGTHANATMKTLSTPIDGTARVHDWRRHAHFSHAVNTAGVTHQLKHLRGCTSNRNRSDCSSSEMIRWLGPSHSGQNRWLCVGSGTTKQVTERPHSEREPA